MLSQMTQPRTELAHVQSTNTIAIEDENWTEKNLRLRWQGSNLQPCAPLFLKCQATLQSCVLPAYPAPW